SLFFLNIFPFSLFVIQKLTMKTYGLCRVGDVRVKRRPDMSAKTYFQYWCSLKFHCLLPAKSGRVFSEALRFRSAPASLFTLKGWNGRAFAPELAGIGPCLFPNETIFCGASSQASHQRAALPTGRVRVEVGV
ncbi:MAG: hypothetical protein AAFN16_07250, partial [Pseudomonadota bacterium]